nr:hypothetical protein [Propionivibrio soli]
MSTPSPNAFGRHDDTKFAGHETLLHVVPFAGTQTGVVHGGRFATLRQSFAGLLGGPYRRRIDDAATGRRSNQVGEAVKPIFLTLEGLDAKVQVRPIDAGIDHLEIVDTQHAPGFGDHFGGGSRRQGENRWATQRLPRAAEFEKCRAKIVAPLREAVRLVNNEEAYTAASEFAGKLGIGTQTLRRSEQKSGRTAAQRFPDLLLARSVECAIERQGADTQRLELVALILHERDERRDDERQPAIKQGGNLVAQRLTGAGRHDGEDVASAKHMFDHPRLAGPEFAKAESLVQQLFGPAPDPRARSRSAFGTRHASRRLLTTFRLGSISGNQGKGRFPPDDCARSCWP